MTNRTRQPTTTVEEQNELEKEEEYFPLDIPKEFQELKAEQTSMSVRDLWQRHLARELLVEPDFQRHYVWDLTRASRFIESLMLRLPTPAIFLAEENDGSCTVIDGHQRLETIFRYMQPLLTGPAKATGGQDNAYRSLPPLTLRSMEVLSDLNGKGVTALSIEDRGRLWDTKLPIILLPRDTHPDMKYVLFARLNQGSMSLNSQELRNCLYRGPYNRLIAYLSERQDFLGLWGRTEPDKRMGHRELVLRFFALLHRRGRYRTPFRAFLNDELEENRNLSEDEASRLRKEFEAAVLWVPRVFGKEAFRRFSIGTSNDPAGKWERRRFDMVYELEMVGFAQHGDLLEQFWSKADTTERQLLIMMLRRHLIDVMTNEHFRATLSSNTTGQSSVETRFGLWQRALQETIGDPEKAVTEGEMLLDQLRVSTICGACPYQLTPDDAVWVTVEGHPKLVHRYCTG